METALVPIHCYLTGDRTAERRDETDFLARTPSTPIPTTMDSTTPRSCSPMATNPLLDDTDDATASDGEEVSAGPTRSTSRACQATPIPTSTPAPDVGSNP